MHIPKQIKIGAFLVDIRLVKDLPDNGNLIGEDIIFLDADLSVKAKGLTLMHEIVHAINPAMSEMDVEWLSRALYQVFEDNHLLK